MSLKNKILSFIKKLIRIARIVFITVLSLFILIALWTIFTIPSLGDLKHPQFKDSIRFYDINGKYLFYKSPVEQKKNTWVSISKVPESLINLIVVLEDMRFKHHKGLDYSQIYNAIAQNLSAFKLKYGASTITQQLIKNVYLNNKKSFIRKIQEMILAAKIEKKLNKQNIMEWYLNIIEMAPGIYGIREGSLYYFNVEPRGLTFKQQVFLACIIPSPKYFNKNRKSILKKIAGLSKRFLKYGLINLSQFRMLKKPYYTFRKNRRDRRFLYLKKIMSTAIMKKKSLYGKRIIKLSIIKEYQERLIKELLKYRLNYATAGHLIVVKDDEYIRALHPVKNISPFVIMKIRNEFKRSFRLRSTPGRIKIELVKMGSTNILKRIITSDKTEKINFTKHKLFFFRTTGDRIKKWK
ncbi:MAG: penicillin-binding protein [Spirochaetes bacterium]|nr:penicillin-binding protein [Spirochaetota bacterium]